MSTGPFYRPSNMFNIEDEYGPSLSDQRHRLVFNGLVGLPAGFQLGGLYFFGSGNYYTTRVGGDPFSNGTTRNRYVDASASAKLGLPVGTITPRNDLVGDALHRVDLRISNLIQAGARVQLEPVFEVFNLFNHANYGGYEMTLTSSRFGQPTRNTNVAYNPRVIQLGFRVSF